MASPLLVVRKHRADQSTLNEVLDITGGKNAVSIKPKEIHTLLKREETVNNILMNKIRKSVLINSTNFGSHNRVLYDAGAPAECVTHEEVLRR